VTELIDHPPHYGGADNPYETIKVLRSWLSPEQFLGFLRGNAIKYLSRAGKKGDAGTDAGKAAWYATREAEFLAELAALPEAGPEPGGPMPGTEALTALGFRPLAPDEAVHNPMRLYIVMPVRGEDGVWFSVPVMQAPLPENCEVLLQLAQRLEAERRPRSFLNVA
jgi:hypothetical protein